MIKTIILCLLFSFARINAFTQNAAGMKHIEDVKGELRNSKADTNRVLLYNEVCTAYQWSNVDSLNLYSTKGIELAKQLHFPRGEVRILNNLAVSLAFHGNIPKSLEVSFKALDIAEKNNYTFETALCLNNIGVCYSFLNDKSKSLDFIKRANAINENIQPVAADVYWKIYIEFWLGTAYSDLNKLDSASYFLQKAYNDAFDPGFTDLYSIRPTILMFYGDVLFKKGNRDTALQYLHRSIETYSIHNDAIGIPDACAIIAGFFKQMGQPDSVVYYAKKGLDAAQKVNYNSAVINNSKLLADEYESKDKGQAYATMQTDCDSSLEKIKIIPQDIGRVLLNLFNNAFYAVQQKQKELAKEVTPFEKVSPLYQPTVSVGTKKSGDKILLIVKDNGNGIPQKVLDKIFQPFFTTKPTGQGTGLGLSLSYDIIKAHGGEIKVETEEGEGTEFIIQLPV